MSRSKRDLKKNRIRAFFASLELKAKKKSEFATIEEEILQNGMVYKQMRLPVSNITPKFETLIEEKIKQNFLRAKIRTLNEGKKEDLKSIINIYNRAWLTSSVPFRPLDLTSLKKIFNDPDTVVLIASVYGIDGAFAILDFEGKAKDIGVIAALGVLPKFQRKKLGLCVGLEAWKYLKKHGVKELRCEVYKDNVVSYSFIMALGFEEFDVKAYKKEDFEIEDVD